MAYQFLLLKKTETRADIIQAGAIKPIDDSDARIKLSASQAL